MTIELLQGAALDVLRTMPSELVHCIITSPPYWGLRSYGTEPQVWRNGSEPCADGHTWGESATKVFSPQRDSCGGIGNKGTRGEQSWTQGTTATVSQGNTCTCCGAWRGELGLEPTPELFVEHIVAVMREARRVLRADGTAWINLGDSYNGSGGAGGWSKNRNGATDNPNRDYTGLKPKDLVGIPWRVAFALQADGWYLRSDIIWAKPNPMPESVRDRPTKAHEYIFLMSKSPRYYYDADAVRENLTESSIKRDKTPRGRRQNGGGSFESMTGIDYTTELGDMKCNPAGRNRRSVWTVTTTPFSGAKLMADYVDEDGKPYKASPDCPLHSHLARSQKSDTQSGGEQSSLSENRNSDKQNGHAQSPLCESVSTTLIHSGEYDLSQNVPAQIPESIVDRRTLTDQSEHTLPAQNLSHTTHRLESDVPSDRKTDSGDRQCALPAKSRSKRKNKSDRAHHTSERDTACAQTLFDTHHTLQSDALADSADHTCESNSAVLDSCDIQRTQTADHNGRKSRDTTLLLASDSSQEQLYCTCTKVSIDHFATFPPKLIEPCILAATSERGVCSKCGAPWVRVVEREQPERQPLSEVRTTPQGTHKAIGQKYNNWLNEHPAQTTGWRASCDCDAGEPVPATVLDPFNGAGTTGLVALQHGRRYIGIELKAEYIEMTRKRLEGAQIEMAQ